MMDKSIFERAKELEKIISTLNNVLNVKNRAFHFAEYCNHFRNGFYYHYEVPEEIIVDCKEVIHKYINKYQEEFDNIINSPQQVSTIEIKEDSEPENNEEKKEENKPWYNFIWANLKRLKIGATR